VARTAGQEGEPRGQDLAEVLSRRAWSRRSIRPATVVEAARRESFASTRDRTAYVQMDRTLTYAELDARSHAFGAWLQQAHRPRRGGRVAIMLPNVLQYPIALFGALRAGLHRRQHQPAVHAARARAPAERFGRRAIVILENFAHTLQEVLARPRLARHRHQRRRAARIPEGHHRRFVVRHVARPCPHGAPRRGPLRRGCSGGARAPPRAGAARPRRHRVPAVHRRHDRRVEGRDAHPPQHGRERAAVRGLGPSRSSLETTQPETT
jgi:hypothetical protein